MFFLESFERFDDQCVLNIRWIVQLDKLFRWESLCLRHIRWMSTKRMRNSRRSCQNWQLRYTL